MGIGFPHDHLIADCGLRIADCGLPIAYCRLQEDQAYLESLR